MVHPDGRKLLPAPKQAVPVTSSWSRPDAKQWSRPPRGEGRSAVPAEVPKPRDPGPHGVVLSQPLSSLHVQQSDVRRCSEIRRERAVRSRYLGAIYGNGSIKRTLVRVRGHVILMPCTPAGFTLSTMPVPTPYSVTNQEVQAHIQHKHHNTYIHGTSALLAATMN